VPRPRAEQQEEAAATPAAASLDETRKLTRVAKRDLAMKAANGEHVAAGELTAVFRLERALSQVERLQRLQELTKGAI